MDYETASAWLLERLASNQLPPACDAGTLPDELRSHVPTFRESLSMLALAGYRTPIRMVASSRRLSGVGVGPAGSAPAACCMSYSRSPN
jgi:hypothetical protein